MLFAKSVRITATALAGMAMTLGSGAAIAAPACQAGGQGCLLPIGAVPASAPVTPIEAPLAAEEAGRGFGGLLLLGAGLLIAGIIAFIVLDGNDDEPASP